jgi:hypothetical protein
MVSVVALIAGALSDGSGADVFIELLNGATVAMCEGAGLRIRL